jgi:DUF4097 and DUF4098 domain-containing protein YvlB
VVARNVTGDVDLESSGGGVHAQAVDGAIRASTSGGDVEADLVGMNRGISASTSGGSIVVRLPRAVSAVVDLSTSGGSVSCDLPLTTRQASRGSLQGVINAGGASIKAHTSGGSVRLVPRD